MSHEGMAPFSGMSRMRNPKPSPNMYYPQGEGPPLMPPMQQMRMNQPSYLDDRQMNSPCGYPRMPMGGTPPEFKSPQMMPTMTEAPGPAPKKKRRNAASAAAPPPPPPPIMDMMPPPLSGYGDTIVASNPFDDMPSHHPPPPMMMPPHRGMPPGGPPPHGMNSPMMPGPMSPMMRSPLQEGMMGPGGPMQMQPMGMMSPMGQQQMPPMSHQQQPPPQQQPPFAQMAPKPMPVTTGKIYPPDQPMVFNPQNPNAPPIYPCGICHKEVHDNDQAILCESGCNFWFHRICTGLTEAAYQLLTAEVYAEWVCDKCLASKNIPLVKCKP